MTTSEQDKLIDKIRKLLALADETKAGSPEEAASAAAKVQALIEKYNLDMSLIQNGAKSHMVMRQFPLPTSRRWAKTLLHVLASHGFCRALWNSSYHIAFLLGDPANIDATLYLFDHLTKQLSSMATVYYANYKHMHRYSAVAPQTFHTNFYRGAVNAIWHRLDEQRTKFYEEHETGKRSTNQALIVVDETAKALNDFQAETFPEVKIRRQSQAYVPERRDGFEDGLKAGLIVEMNKLVK